MPVCIPKWEILLFFLLRSDRDFLFQTNALCFWDGCQALWPANICNFLRFYLIFSSTLLKFYWPRSFWIKCCSYCTSPQWSSVSLLLSIYLVKFLSCPGYYLKDYDSSKHFLSLLTKIDLYKIFLSISIVLFLDPQQKSSMNHSPQSPMRKSDVGQEKEDTKVYFEN